MEGYLFSVIQDSWLKKSTDVRQNIVDVAVKTFALDSAVVELANAEHRQAKADESL